MMSREWIIKQVAEFFSIDELVCPHVFQRWGEQAWQFLDTDYLHCLLVIRRDILNAPMICNNGSTYTQRGLRCNMCEVVKNKKKAYLSAHILGKAGDFTVQDMTAEEARQKIKQNAHLLPCFVRVEGGVSWLHFDVIPMYGVEVEVYEFKA